ncbi:chitin binding domain-containing [Chlorella sorokiniana]|uniref:Chitin binding domain-containing n=1 Tax=Chlorella sorokiniana TaxID=3076 RepID=A0A2P6TTH3_CHLSO|nr:chitin binding domain-containing [Chlorella sorokiniana]|eukprot:PRW57371.1 chitin binding domain-containing [Chlorella sorokiniana]
MNSRVLLLAAALALACLALGAQARDLQQVGDEAQALIAQQVAAQEKKIKNYREFEQDHNSQQEDVAASGGRKGGRKGRHSSDSGSDSGSTDSGSSDTGSDSGSNPWYGRDPSNLSKSEKRKARREAKKLGLSLEEYLGWTGGSDGSSSDGSSQEEAPKKKGRKGRRSSPAQDDSSSDVPVTKGRRGKGGRGGKRASYHYYSPAYETSQLYCADAFRGKESGLLGRPWTAWCVGAMKQEYCGRCVRITNLSTGDTVEATVVDACGFDGVDMDPLAFNAIDGDGEGYRAGTMSVSVEWC